MSHTFNFAEIKQRISIAQGVKYLGLTLKADGNSLRTACPACQSDPRSLSILEEGNTFKCFKSGKYGSVIDLVAHVKGLGLREACAWLVEQENSEWLDEYSDADPKEEEHEKLALSPLEKLPKLDAGHDEVKALGLRSDVALEAGIGFASTGLMRGCVAIPVYSSGNIVGYIGIAKGTTVKIPSNLT